MKTELRNQKQVTELEILVCVSLDLNVFNNFYLFFSFSYWY